MEIGNYHIIMTTEEKEQDIQKLMRGLEIAEFRMLKEKTLKGQMVVHGDGKGGYKIIPAKEVFARLYPKEAAMLKSELEII